MDQPRRAVPLLQTVEGKAMYLRSGMSSRNQFGKFLNARRLTRNGVEIGTHRADYASILLDAWEGRLYCVDPWSVPEGYEEQALRLPEGARRDGVPDREADYDVAVARLRKYDHRARVLRMTSAEANALFDDGSLDFVYIDGDHSEMAVFNDLRWWWPKLRDGGIIAGHDWLCPGEEAGLWAPAIQEAVYLFSCTCRLDVNLIVEEGGLPWSFYMVRPTVA